MAHRTLALAALAALLLTSPAAAREISFSGHAWTVRGNGTGGPGPNQWSDSASSIWVDDAGDLHLTLRRPAGIWYASEVFSNESFGYGEYRFQLKTNVEGLDPQAVLGLFTYLDDENEIDIEFARWGDGSNPAGNYATQPAGTPGNHETFGLGLEGSFSSHRFRWTPEEIIWQSYHGHYDDDPPVGNLIHAWSYTGPDIPTDQAERVHMNLWLVGGQAPQNGQDAEVVISKFQFVPLSALPEPATGALSLGLLVGMGMRRGARARGEQRRSPTRPTGG